MASGSPDPAGPWSAKAASGWNPKVTGRGGLGLLRVRRHDRRVQVHGDQPVIRAGRGQPGDHRVRGHRTGQVRLCPQHRDIGQAVTAQGNGHRQVRDDLARIVDGSRCAPPLQSGGQLLVQAGHAQGLGNQDRSGLGDDSRSVGGHPHLRADNGKIHLESASRTGVEWTLDKPYSPSSRHFSHV
jgi:hypothetical protein